MSFAGETPASEKQVVATAHAAGDDTVLTYTDHSTVTLIGVTHVDTGIFTEGTRSNKRPLVVHAPGLETR
jgi:hypothetical protein